MTRETVPVIFMGGEEVVEVGMVELEQIGAGQWEAVAMPEVTVGREVDRMVVESPEGCFETTQIRLRAGDSFKMNPTGVQLSFTRCQRATQSPEPAEAEQPV